MIMVLYAHHQNIGFYLFYFLLITSCIYKGLSHPEFLDDPYKSTIQKLRNDLLKNYDKLARPVLDDSNTTTVSFGLSPIYLMELNEANQYIKLEAWVKLTWNDNHLKWEPRNYSDISLVHFAIDEIWHPDISVYSSIPISEIAPHVKTKALSIYSGTVLWVPPATIYSFCSVDYKDYPNDIQECNITFGSWTYHGIALNLEIDKKGLDFEYFKNTNHKWELINSNIHRLIKYYNCCTEPYHSITTTFKLKRKHLADPGLVMWGPSFVAILFTLIMFWIPSNSLHKFILGCTSIMILTLMVLYIGGSRSSSIAILLSARSIHSMMFIIASAMLMEIIIINLGRIAGTFRPPAMLTYWLSGIVGKILLIYVPKRRFGIVQKMEESQDAEEEFTSEDHKEEWLLISTALDRICFVIYLLVFIVQRNI